MPKMLTDRSTICRGGRRRLSCRACRGRKEYRVGPLEFVAKTTASPENCDRNEGYAFSAAVVDRRSWRRIQARLRLLRGGARTAIGREATQQRRGAAECGRHRQTARAFAEGLKPVSGASRVGGDHALGKARAPSGACLATSPNRKSTTLPQSAKSSSWHLHISQGVLLSVNSRTLEPLP